MLEHAKQFVQRRERVLCLAALAVVTLVFSLPLLTHTPLPWGSDTHFAYRAADSFNQAIREGEVYPRWMNDLNNGFGGPVFLFYSPLPFYAVAAASVFTTTLVDAFKAVLIAAAFLSALSFYLSARPFGSRWGAVLGAGFYVLAPYHVLDLYERFAFAETLAFVWFPPLFLFTRRLLVRPDAVSWAGLALVYAGLVFTHLVSAFMALFVLAPYALYWSVRTRRWKRLLLPAGAGAAALCLSAVFLLPAVHQRGRVHMEWQVESPHGAWRRNFPWRDEVALGYVEAPIKPRVEASVAVQAGLSLLAGGWLIAPALRRRRTGEPAPVSLAAADGWGHLLLSAWTLFLQVPLSAPLWEYVPDLETVQFPWRFGIFQALSASFLVSCVLAREDGKTALSSTGDRPPGRTDSTGDRDRAKSLGMPAALTLVLALVPVLVLDVKFVGVRDYVFDRELARKPKYVYIFKKEYLPADWPGWSGFVPRPPGAFTEAGMVPPGRAEIVSWTQHKRTLRARNTGPSTLELRTFAYPGWQARENGRLLEIRPGSQFHSVSVDLPAGEHRLEFSFPATWDRCAGSWISAVSLAVLLVAGAAWRLRRR